MLSNSKGLFQLPFDFDFLPFCKRKGARDWFRPAFGLALNISYPGRDGLFRLLLALELARLNSCVPGDGVVGSSGEAQTTSAPLVVKVASQPAWFSTE